ncbi:MULTISPECIES: DUF305 domain-containing protein [unclassified Paraburkholderia]|uniref:DUF305 domain-containing protein n=1 Tax=unclassified Paraburkholderia TaxID=2615204 RepID=UPI000E27F2F9|nr:MULTISPECIES: DUF305 domain-containing protein [unclassified Paraburkholderia]REE23790.1 hypothetical protein B0G71_7079 [Paraburkholderia sp. BL27I4N3]RKR37909.1 hypothetical protein B0G82_6024 [Paraburkholderia sp. BL17N1]
MRTPSPRTALTILSVVIVLAISALCDSPAFTAGLQTDGTSNETPFLAENNTAMTRMMDGMSTRPTGNVDRDFVAMMVPHHQGAIDMAQAELRYGHNEQLRRIAQEIVVEQQQEIVAMRVALGQPLPPPAAAPDQQKPASMPVAPVHRPSDHGMQMNTPNPMQEDQQ